MGVLILTDLDGTLLRSDRTVSATTRRVLGDLAERGVRVGFATARSAERALVAVGDLPFSAPCAALNGAVILEPDGAVRAEHRLDPDLVADAAALGAELGVEPFLSGREDGRDVLMHTDRLGPYQRRFLEQRAGDRRFRRVATLRPLPSTLVLSFFVAADEAPDLEAALAGRGWSGVTVSAMDDIHLPGGRTLEVRDARATKGAALREIRDALGLPAEATVAFGDQENDADLLAEAGIAVAVANAHPALRRVARDVCSSNDDDGVARWLAEHFAL